MVAGLGALLLYFAAFPANCDYSNECGSGIVLPLEAVILVFPVGIGVVAAAIMWLIYFARRRETTARLTGPWTQMLAVAAVLLIAAAAFANGPLDALLGTSYILAWLWILIGGPAYLVRMLKQRRKGHRQTV